MKNLSLILVLMAGYVFKCYADINPEKTLLYPFLTMNSYKKSDAHIIANGLKFDTFKQKFTPKSRRVSVDAEEFYFLQTLSKSVFKTSTSEARSAHGSAFHVGGRFVLTAQHVLSPSRKNSSKCKGFKITLNGPYDGVVLNCKEVHYCNRLKDFCLIEMKDHKKGYSLNNFTPLKLFSSYSIGPLTEHYAIGNSQGFGIHASKGINISHQRVPTRLRSGKAKKIQRLIFYAPVHSGNSGGPILNTQGDVIGLVTVQMTRSGLRPAKNIESNKNINIGVPMVDILAELQEKLSHKKDVLDNITL